MSDVNSSNGRSTSRNHIDRNQKKNDIQKPETPFSPLPVLKGALTRMDYFLVAQNLPTALEKNKFMSPVKEVES